MHSLKSKVALITGSGRGLGKAIAERYAELGANIVIHYSQDKSAAKEAVRHMEARGVRAIAVQADVSKVADVERLFGEATKAFGKIDIVVANAEVELADLPVTKFTEEQFDRLFTLNTKGACFTMQQAARYVADHGRIINVASTTPVHPSKGVAIYGRSKTAPEYMVEELAKEIGHRGVTVNSIVPYAVDHAGVFTRVDHPMRKWLIEACPMKRMAQVEDVANVAEFFASELSSFVNGHHLVVNGGAIY